MGYGHAGMCCSLCWTCIWSTCLSTPLSQVSLLTVATGIKDIINFCIYYIELLLLARKADVWSVARYAVPGRGPAYLRGRSSLVWCVDIFVMTSDTSTFDLVKAVWMSLSGLFLNYFWKTVFCLCDCFHRNHNLWKYTASDFRHRPSPWQHMPYIPYKYGIFLCKTWIGDIL